MTKKIGNAIFIYEEEPQLCELCGEIKETRPYGKNGANICFECSEKPENKKIVDNALNKLFRG